MRKMINWAELTHWERVVIYMTLRLLGNTTGGDVKYTHLRDATFPTGSEDRERRKGSKLFKYVIQRLESKGHIRVSKTRPRTISLASDVPTTQAS